MRKMTLVVLVTARDVMSAVAATTTIVVMAVVVRMTVVQWRTTVVAGVAEDEGLDGKTTEVVRQEAPNLQDLLNP